MDKIRQKEVRSRQQKQRTRSELSAHIENLANCEEGVGGRLVLISLQVR